jgi:hypothetical protein
MNLHHYHLRIHYFCFAFGIHPVTPYLLCKHTVVKDLSLEAGTHFYIFEGKLQECIFNFKNVI